MKAHEAKGPNAPISHFELEELKREDENRGKMLGYLLIGSGVVLMVALVCLAIYWSIHRGGTTKKLDPMTGFYRPHYSASYEEDYLSK